MAAPLTLRRARPDDGAAIAAIYAPYVTGTIITFETEAPSAEAIAERIANGLAADLPWLVALDATSQIVGYAYAARFHPRHAYRFTIEPSIYVAEAAQRSGIGHQLYERLFAILTGQGFRQAVALIALPNDPSIAIHSRFGFRHKGTHESVGHKFGRWIDVGLWQRTIGPADTPLEQDNPLPLRASASWSALS